MGYIKVEASRSLDKRDIFCGRKHLKKTDICGVTIVTYMLEE